MAQAAIDVLRADINDGDVGFAAKIGVKNSCPCFNALTCMMILKSVLPLALLSCCREGAASGVWHFLSTLHLMLFYGQPAPDAELVVIWQLLNPVLPVCWPPPMATKAFAC